SRHAVPAHRSKPVLDGSAVLMELSVVYAASRPQESAGNAASRRPMHMIAVTYRGDRTSRATWDGAMALTYRHLCPVLPISPIRSRAAVCRHDGGIRGAGPGCDGKPGSSWPGWLKRFSLHVKAPAGLRLEEVRESARCSSILPVFCNNVPAASEAGWASRARRDA